MIYCFQFPSGFGFDFYFDFSIIESFKYVERSVPLITVFPFFLTVILIAYGLSADHFAVAIFESDDFMLLTLESEVILSNM